MQSITPCLWFDTEGEEAAAFYTSLFPNSRIVEVARYGEAGPRAAGTVMTVLFELDGQEFAALNGGPEFSFNEAISFLIDCKSQEEVDYYWDKLTDGGEPGPSGSCRRCCRWARSTSLSSKRPTLRSSDGCHVEQFSSVVCNRFPVPVSGRGLSQFGGTMGTGYEHVLGL